ncbi:MAG: YHS domain-containing protein [Candidatus Thorarchaeota archaeon]
MDINIIECFIGVSVSPFIRGVSGESNERSNRNIQSGKKVTKMAKCPVCGMMGKPHIKSVYKGKTYYFMNEEHKKMFDANPEKFNLEVGIRE